MSMKLEPCIFSVQNASMWDNSFLHQNAIARNMERTALRGASIVKIPRLQFHSDCSSTVSILDALHDSILLLIQEKLTHPLDLQAWSLTCKHLYLLEASNRSRLSLLRVHTFPSLALRYPHLRHLDLSPCTFLSDEGLGCVARAAGKRLLSLNLSKVCTFSDYGLFLLATKCESLLHLNLSKCSQVQNPGAMALAHIRTLLSLNLHGCKDVTDSGIAFLVSKCKRLQSLSLKWCLGITDEALVAVAANCRGLQELDISHTEVTSSGLSAISKLKYLVKLSLTACSCVDDEGLTHLSKGSESLQTLDVSKCRGISYSGIMGLANRAFPLQNIALSYCFPVTDALLQSFCSLKSLCSVRFDGCDVSGVDLGLIGKCCVSLRQLSLSKCKGVTDAGVSAAVVGCPSLQNIDLTCCHSVTDVSVLSIATCCKALLSFKVESCSQVTEQGLEKLCNSCHLLEELDLTDTSINDAGLMSVAKCRNLRTLKLGFCEGIQDNGLVHIASSCSSLGELDVYRCRKVTDRGIAAICKGCINLKMLNVSFCSNITDIGLLAVAQLRDLSILEVRGCTKVSSVGLISVARGCQRLVELDIKRCTSIEDFAPVALAQFCKNLRKINMSYCRATDEGMIALARLECMQQMRLVHVENVSVQGFAGLLQAGESLRKVKLLVYLKEALLQATIEQVEKRGCRFKWTEKL